MDAVKIDESNLDVLNSIDEGVLCYCIISNNDFYNAILFNNGSNYIYSYNNNSFYYMNDDDENKYTNRLKKTINVINNDIENEFNKNTSNAKKNIDTLTSYEKKYRK